MTSEKPTMDDRFRWETDFAWRGRGGNSHYPWESSVSIAWTLVRWIMERTDDEMLAWRFLDEDYAEIDYGRFERILAVLAAAILEEAWRQDRLPKQVGLQGLIEHLDELYQRRHIEPFYDREDDLWPLLHKASTRELNEWMGLIRKILTAHMSAAQDAERIEDLLSHCPLPHGGGARLLFEGTRRQYTNREITPVPPARTVTFDGTITAKRIDPNSFDEEEIVVRCPQCDTTRGLKMSSETGEQAVTGRCPNGHTWDVPELTSRWLGKVLAQNRSNPTIGNREESDQ